MFKKILILIIPLCLLLSIINSQQIVKQKIPILTIARPDIVVEKIKITKQPSSKSGKVYLKIEFWISPGLGCLTQIV